MRRVAIVVALVVVLGGAGTGIAFAVRGGSGISPADARAQVARLERQWRAELRAGARSDPARRFPSPPLSWLEGQLRDAEGLCGCFTVLHITLLHPVQTAPLVVVETTDELTFFHRHPLILDLLDKVPSSLARGGWAYEGFLLEARNGAGVPFLASDVYLRGSRYGGGSFWAVPRIERLVPHG